MTEQPEVARRKHLNFAEAKEVFARGENVTQHLQLQLGIDHNTPEIIEMAYDLQAGSYIKYAEENSTAVQSYTTEAAAIIDRYLSSGNSILDIGCGELTTFSQLVNRLSATPGPLLAFDLSWSRIKVGRAYASRNLKNETFDRLSLFTAEIGEIPLLSKSVDIVISSHALEPNGGSEPQLLAEILRVARRYAILLEPSYELNSPEGRLRMDRLGYVRDLERTAIGLGAIVETIVPFANVSNKLNPTAAYVIRLADEARGAKPDFPFSDPGGGSPLRKFDTFYFSSQRGVSYPVIDGIPILRSRAAVLTSALASDLAAQTAGHTGR